MPVIALLMDKVRIDICMFLLYSLEDKCEVLLGLCECMNLMSLIIMHVYDRIRAGIMARGS